MTPYHRNSIIDELARLEFLGYIGLVGKKYLSEGLLTPDDLGNRVRAINLAPAKGWAIVAYGKPGEELKHKFLKNVDRGWVYDGVERMEAVH